MSEGEIAEQTAETEQQEIQHAISEKIAEALDEHKKGARWTIHRIVKLLGGPAVVSLLQETLTIERQGGMQTNDGTRRRTSGGVFFQLAKQRMTSRERYRIFQPAHKAKARKRAAERAQAMKKEQALLTD